MIRWVSAILVAAWAVSCDPLLAQVPQPWQPLQRRVVLEPELELDDPLEDFDPWAVAGWIGAASFSRPTASTEILTSAILERMADGRYDKALAESRHLLSEEEPSLAQPTRNEFAGSDGMTSRDVHFVAQDRLLRLPPSLLAKYREGIDPEAARLLADAAARRDPAPLRRLLRDFRASSHAPAALALLGDLAFERGDFDLALSWWRRIVPLPTRSLYNRQAGEPNRPRPGVDVPRIQAKQTLALLFADRPDAANEIDAIGTLYPDLGGEFAGRNGTYHAILTHWAETLRTSSSRVADDAWPTFAGDASRNRALGAAPSDRLWIDGPAWRVPLPRLGGKATAPVWLSATRSMTIPATPIHPVIAEGQILYSDGHTIRSHDLFTGKLRFRTPTPGIVWPVAGEPVPISPAFSLSLAPGRALARVGARPADPRPRRLVCLDLHKPGQHIDRVLWSASPENDDAFYESDPLVVGDAVYIQSIHRGENKSTRYLQCFDLHGKSRWRVKLADFTGFDDKSPTRFSLLASAGPAIVCATQAGVVAAVDAWSGRRLWAFRYPTIDNADSPRGPASCLVANDRVYLAPADSPALFCLDAGTGRSLWERPWLKPPSDIVPGPPDVSEIVDLLGVVGDRLVFTDRFRIQALDAYTGGILAWQQPAVGKLPGQGRGLIAGPWIFWPTADTNPTWRTLLVGSGHLKSPDARPQSYDPTSLRDLSAGNIVMGQGCLAIAGPDELVVYVPSRDQGPELERIPEVRRTPADWYRLALAQLADKHDSRAQQSLATLERGLTPTERDRWRQLVAARLSEPPAQSAAPRRTQEPLVIHPRPLPEPAPSPSPVTQLTRSWGPRPGVAPPAERLDPNSTNPLVVVLDGEDVVVLDAKSGNERQRRRRLVEHIDWIGQLDNVVMLAGRDGLEAFDGSDQVERGWWARNPLDEGRRPFWRLIAGQPVDAAPPPRPIHAALFHGQWLLDDGQRLAAIDPLSGEEHPLNTRRARTFMPSSFVRSGPLDTRPIPIANEVPSLPNELRRTVVVNGDSWLVPRTGGRVERIGADATRWTFHPTGSASLTGEPAEILAGGSVAIAVIPRNHGHEIVRLDVDTGRPLWSISPLVFPDGFKACNAVIAERTLIFVHRGVMVAVDVGDGGILWRTPLPLRAGPWRAARFGDGVLAWPTHMAGVPMLPGPIDPISAAWSLWCGRRGLGMVPILSIDAAGKIRDRIEIPADRGPFFVEVRGLTALVSASGRVEAWTAIRNRE